MNASKLRRSLLFFALSLAAGTTTAFTGVRPPGGDPFRRAPSSAATTTAAFAGATTVEAPTRERTDRSTRTSEDTNDTDYPDLEYLQDPSASREDEDPFHILLLGSTFEKPKITVTYVSGSLEYVLNMPLTEAKELSQFALDEGMSCLGTWTREECLSLGRQLQVRDIVCRVVPYAEGGQRGWQAKDASSGDSSAYYGSGDSLQ